MGVHESTWVCVGRMLRIPTALTLIVAMFQICIFFVYVCDVITFKHDDVTDIVNVKFFMIKFCFGAVMQSNSFEYSLASKSLPLH